MSDIENGEADVRADGPDTAEPASAVGGDGPEREAWAETVPVPVVACGGRDAPATEKPLRRKERFFTATRMAYIAIFTALSYVLYIFDFPVLGAVPFLKLDFSNLFVMIAGFSLGPVSGVVVGVLKELIHALTFGQTAFVGELANIIMILPYVLIPSVVYRRRKGIRTVVVTLVIASLAQCAVSVPVNWLLTFPAYCVAYMGWSWSEGMAFFLDVWYWALLFNLIKTVIISAATLIVYKPLSALIKATGERMERRSRRRA